MRKKVGIYSGVLYFPQDKVHKWDENSLSKGDVGGCEVWAIEISDHLQKIGYDVILFADCEAEHYSKSGVRYIPYTLFDKYCSENYFNYFISSRYNSIITNKIKAEKVFLFSQDPFILDSEDTLNLNYIDKVVVQSEYHKGILKEKYNIPDDMFEMTFQAINHDLYKDNAVKKKNQMVWSSHKSRGAKYFLEEVFPLIKKEVPDFEVVFCSYINDCDDDYFKKDGVRVFGTATKEELAKLQLESKVWVYPNTGIFENKENEKIGETFCITAIENGLAGNAIVCANKHGFSTTLNGYVGFIESDLFNDKQYIESAEDRHEFAVMLANQTVKILKDEKYFYELSQSAKDVCKKYTWDNAAKSWDGIFKEKENFVKNRISALVIYNGELDTTQIKNGVYGGDNAAIDFKVKHIRNCNCISKVLYKFKYVDTIVSVGDNDFRELNNAPYNIRRRWVHFDELDYNAIGRAIVENFKFNINRNVPTDNRLISIFTSCYNTEYGVFMRLYNSLLSQTHSNWNWWILDDSTDGHVEEYVNALADYRLHLIKNVTDHSSIGFNKHLIAMACDGDYLVEVDHDDELTYDCLELIDKAFKKYPDADFVYSLAFENKNGEAIIYGKGWGFGYGENRESTIFDGEKVLISATPSVNPVTIRTIYAQPNHVRCWRKDFYHKIGGHNPDLFVLDDQELLIRTFIYGKMCKIDKILYIQNEGEGERGEESGSTTQSWRFNEIQRTCWILKTKYDKLIHERILSLGHNDSVWDENNGVSILGGIHEKAEPICYVYEP